MPFTFEAAGDCGPILVAPRLYEDSRGHFFETYKQSEFTDGGITEVFVQTNASRSVRDVVRGLHYQLPPHAQAKLVRCVAGAIFDVAVDIRRGSPTFGRWVAQELTADNRLMLYIPEGFAHGFLALSETAEVNYMVSAEYHPETERGIVWDDPDIGIDWPTRSPLLSPKDAVFPGLRTAEVFD